jgi:3-methyladenine DNA glycosylase/8-oxoguanine DNA glycosylase
VNSSPAEVAAFIAKRDKAFRPIIALAGPPPLRRRAESVDNRFPSLVRSITHQLLATSAATTIHGRVVDTCGGTVTIHTIIAAGPERLRGAGLNRTKAQAMVDLATEVRDNRLQLAKHGRMSDDDIVRDVASVRGIGPWTAQMYLISTMARPDVWPTGDYGVRVGWSLLHGLDETISEAGLREAGERFVGARTSVAWYCWEAVHFAKVAKSAK